MKTTGKKSQKSRGTTKRAKASPRKGGGELKLKFEPRGPEQSVLDGLARTLLEAPAVREHVTRTRSRLLSLEMIDDDPETKTPRVPKAPDRFRATIYDYTNSRTIRAEGSLDSRKRITVEVSGDQPLPANEEFNEAVSILTGEGTFASSLREQRLSPYRPMPPLVGVRSPDGRTERTLAVGLSSADGGARHEIVGVNLSDRAVTRFDSGAPETSMAGGTTCGEPYASQPTATRGTAGQVWVTVTQGGKVIWKFLVVRPAASSGTRGSGVELRYVDYKGKRLLYRAHVPILNVRYDNDACGPYRDWQYEEGMIQAVGANVAPGFVLCPNPATTILDTGSDAGNFLGVGIYVQGQEVVLVSEMEAGWYRYVSQWRLHTDGTIRPRFGFSAVDTSSCVCNRHHHHVYWRFDFDIRTPGNNIVREFNDPPIIGNSKWHTKQFEIKRPRDPAHKRKWRVENSVTGEAYDIIPGPNDGEAATSPDAPYPRGDVWILRYRSTELDDGVNCTTGGGGCNTEANIDKFVNGESVNNQDVVIWYAGHVTHDVSHEPPGSFGHIVGPELKRVKW
ncbi:MAG: hypothetical protein QOE46_170 [Acidobacteriota bacterium]|jgi:hypothetical protein|nr:hypothetical protein [Acidobacteriota bacterium]